MPPHSVGSGTISFGLVSIPVRLYTATSSQTVSFNLLHAKCGSRIRQQTFCPVCNTTVERSELVRGFEFAKDQYVRIPDDELKKLEGEASQVIDLMEALKESLAKRVPSGERKPPAKAAPKRAEAAPAPARATAAKKAQGGKK